MDVMNLTVVILAAGQGTRMKSTLPKVLHNLAGKPLLERVVETALKLKPGAVHVVYGHGGEQLRRRLAHLPVNWVEQPQQLGTGHAVDQVSSQLAEASYVLVLYGDVPLITPTTLQTLLGVMDHRTLALLTVELANPFGYGRIVRDAAGRVVRIVEEKDASAAERRISEVNTGFLVATAADLKQWLAQLENNNSQGEYYLTDVIAMAAASGFAIKTTHPTSAEEVLGVNNRAQLAQLERYYQQQQSLNLMMSGVTLADPARVDIRGEVSVGSDTFIDINVVLEGRVTIGSQVTIGPGVVIKDSVIGDNTEILAHCVIEASQVGAGSRIGPFARLRPGTQLAENVHIGNFVEIKKTDVAAGSKINHLSYVGDATVGRNVNIGAGTITCNYDGANKYQTIIGDDVFVGSATQLVAPVTIGAGATIGAGSTITKNAPPGELTLSRAPQQTRSGWRRPVKKR